MTDGRDLSDGFDPTMAKSSKMSTAEGKAAEEQTFADKLAKRSPSNHLLLVATTF
jgi:hypothetical protein